MKHPLPAVAEASAVAVKHLSGKKITVKFGGELVEQADLIKALAQDVLWLQSSGVKVAVCHGGGPQVSKALEKEGIAPVFHRGQRVTDDYTLQVIRRVLRGEINSSIVATFNGIEPRAVGLSGLDAGLFRVKAAEKELGWVGDIKEVNANFINLLLDKEFIPIIASIGADRTGSIFNINADLAASALAAAIDSSVLMLFTNVEGLYRSFEDKSSLINKINVKELEALLPSLASGMIPKVEAAIAALTAGVGEVRILDGRQKHAILNNLAAGNGAGTTITAG